MFQQFTAPPTEPAQVDVRASEQAMSSQELQAAAVARGINLERQEPAHKRCASCVHWRFRSLNPDDQRDRCCMKSLPLINEQGDGLWPRTDSADFCDHFQPCHSGDQERRRLLSVYRFKVLSERLAELDNSELRITIKPKRRAKR